MILNSTHIFCLVSELKETLPGLRVGQVSISSDRKETLLSLRGQKQKLDLFFSTHSEDCRLEIWQDKEAESSRSDFEKTNLLWYAVGAHIRDVEQVDFDRIIRISCGKKTQFGSGERFDLIFELTGRNSNLILVKPDATVVDCLRKIDATRSRSRYVLPGEKYVPPLAPEKGNPLTAERTGFDAPLRSAEGFLAEWLTLAFMGMDQLTAQAIVNRSGLDGERKCAGLSPEEVETLWRAFRECFEEIADRKLNIQVVLSEEGEPEAIGCVDLPFVPDGRKLRCESMNSAIVTFFSQRIEKQTANKTTNRLRRIARRGSNRFKKREEKIREDLGQAEKFEQYKRFGELLMMNKESIKKGQAAVELTDVFDPSQPTVEIPLDPKLGPTANAQKYFKKHKKAKEALSTIKQRESDARTKISRMEEVVARLEDLKNETDLEEIEKNLAGLGLLKQARQLSPRRGEGRPRFRTFLTRSGWEILVGRNNNENDFLTFKVARPDELWFHAQGVPGSHVLLRGKDRKAEPSSSEIKQAAAVAAYFSKARRENKAEVAYTRAKYLRKPKKAKPGLVLVENEKSILVEPGLPERNEGSGEV
jgi:predicted ribosome quality control (RQC) complex YloA/Tae2 family protein